MFSNINQSLITHLKLESFEFDVRFKQTSVIEVQFVMFSYKHASASALFHR